MLSANNSVRNLFLYLISGVLLGIGFIFPPAWIFIFFGLFLFLYVANNSQTLKETVIGSFLVFTSKAMFATSVFWSVNVIAGVDVDLGRWECLLIGLYWLTVSAFIGLGGILCGVGLWFLRIKSQSLGWGFFILLFPLLFVASEIFGSFMFSILTYGEGGSINAAYSLGYVGYLLAEHEGLLQLSRYGGVYILSLVSVLIGTIFWLLFDYKKYNLLIGSVLIFILGLWVSASWDWNKATASSGNIKVVIVDTEFGNNLKNIPNLQEEEYKHKKITEALKVALATKPDYVIMPEGSSYNNKNLNPSSAYRLFRFTNSDPEAIVVDTGPAFLAPNKATVRASIYDGVNKTGWGIDKQYLVPQGEYMPYIYTGILQFLGLDNILNQITRKLYYRPGPLTEYEALPTEVPSVLFCFEGLDPYGVRRLVKERDSEMLFVAHPISHAWFNESKTLRHELDVMLKIQALWNQVPIVSAGNMVDGALYRENGVKVTPQVIEEGENWRVGVVWL